MSEKNKVHFYDYVNHPYHIVKRVLSDSPEALFSKATKAAAERAKNVVSELHVKVGSLDVGADIEIEIEDIEETIKGFGQPPTTNLKLKWYAANKPGLFPSMYGVLSVYPLTATETQLDFKGNYKVPLGLLGEALDAVVGHRIAEASVQQFVKDVAAYLRDEIGD